MAFIPKDWRDLPDVTTPLSADAIKDMEARLATYTDTRVDAETTARTAGDTTNDSLSASRSATTLSSAESYTNNRVGEVVELYQTIIERSAVIPSGSQIQLVNMLGRDGSLVWASEPVQSPAVHSFWFNKDDYTGSNAIPSYDYKLRLVVTFFNGNAALNSNITVAVKPPVGFTANSNGIALNLSTGAQPSNALVTFNAGLSAGGVAIQSTPDFFASDMVGLSGSNVFALTCYGNTAMAPANSVVTAQLQGHWVHN